MKKQENFSFVAIAHWPFRLGLAAAASDFALMWMGGPTARRIVVLLSFVALLRKKKHVFGKDFHSIDARNSSFASWRQIQKKREIQKICKH